MSFTVKTRPKSSEQRFRDALYARSVARGPHGRALQRFLRALSASGKRKRMARLSGKNPWKRFALRFWAYFYKMRGSNPSAYDFSVADTLWSFGGAFLCMLVLAFVNIGLWGREEQGLLLGSFGATAMLVFGAPHAPFAQPRNVIGGHIVSALAGVSVQHWLGGEPWLAAALAVALAVTAMHFAAALHPPGGATALIAVVGSPELKQFGYEYALFPVGASAVAMVLVGILYNNLSKRRRYPIYWW